jgi:hypothetical protein
LGAEKGKSLKRAGENRKRKEIKSGDFLFYCNYFREVACSIFYTLPWFL